MSIAGSLSFVYVASSVRMFLPVPSLSMEI